MAGQRRALASRLGWRLILVFLLLARLADATTFVIGEALHGIALESNGVAVLAYRAAGLPGVLALKGGALLLVS